MLALFKYLGISNHIIYPHLSSKLSLYLFPVVVLYAISSVYFAGVMVRLMLTLTPVVCVLAAIAFSKTFEIYLKDDGRKPTQEELEEKEKNDKYYDKVRCQGQY